MTALTYQDRILRLETPPDYRQRLPLDVCSRIMGYIPPLIDGALHMAIDGASVAHGRPPTWFQRASDLRFVAYDHDGDDTLISLQIPSLGDAAEELYLQRELWDTRPDPGETAIEVLRRVVDEVAAGNEESFWYDPQLLNRFIHMRRVIGREITAIHLAGPGAPTAVTPAVVENAFRLGNITPAGRTVRIVGKLDMIRHSTRGFALRLLGGEEVRGVMDSMEAVEQLTGFFGKPILVHGRAVYRPSGALLRLDAAKVEDGAGASPIFSKAPPPLAVRHNYINRLRPSEIGKSGVAAFFGSWSGDETDAGIEAMLRDLRATPVHGD